MRVQAWAIPPCLSVAGCFVRIMCPACAHYHVFHWLFAVRLGTICKWEGSLVTFRNWLYLFFTSLLIGALASLAVGVYFYFTDPEYILDLSVLIVTAGAGMMFSVLSQMGFFAYMMLNYIARSMIRRRLIWSTLQWILIVVVFFDLIYLRVVFLEHERALLVYSILPVVLMIISIVVAMWKVKLTQPSAFTPTVFFMFVATALEAIPALHENNAEATLFMVVPLIFCNAWQILNLHRLVNNEVPAPEEKPAS